MYLVHPHFLVCPPACPVIQGVVPVLVMFRWWVRVSLGGMASWWLDRWVQNMKNMPTWHVFMFRWWVRVSLGSVTWWR